MRAFHINPNSKFKMSSGFSYVYLQFSKWPAGYITTKNVETKCACLARGIVGHITVIANFGIRSDMKRDLAHRDKLQTVETGVDEVWCPKCLEDYFF